MTPDEIYAMLKEIAPSIAFEATSDVDPSFRWDGDGPDPTEEGYIPQDVDVQATAILKGRPVSGHSYLGGHYILPGEALGDISGYLPQMLLEATSELGSEVDQLFPDQITCIKGEVIACKAFLADEMSRRYDNQ